MQNKKTKELTLLAILTALSVTFGFVAKIPTPTGLLTLVDAGIYFTAFYLGKKEGAIVGGLSAFLIDLLSSAPQWMFISLLIHGAQGYFAGFKGNYRILGLLICYNCDGGWLCTCFSIYVWNRSFNRRSDS